jgi:hypothetical protein
MVVLVVVAIVFGTGPLPLAAAEGAIPTSSLSGRVFTADAKTPVGDAVVKAFHRGTDVVLASQATGPDGSYVIEGLTQGEYELGISTAEGIYLVADAVRFEASQKRAASFALQRGTEAEEQTTAAEGQESTSAEGQKKTDEPQKADQDKKQGKESTKLKRPRASSAARTPLVATGIVIGAAIVIGAVASNMSNDGDGSPN